MTAPTGPSELSAPKMTSMTAPTGPSGPFELPVPQASKDNLKPAEIDLTKIGDREERKKQETAVRDWLQKIQKEVSDILEKEGVDVFQLCILHKGTKNPLVLWRGGIYSVAKLARHAASALKSQVLEELSE